MRIGEPGSRDRPTAAEPRAASEPRESGARPAEPEPAPEISPAGSTTDLRPQPEPGPAGSATELRPALDPGPAGSVTDLRAALDSGPAGSITDLRPALDPGPAGSITDLRPQLEPGPAGSATGLRSALDPGPAGSTADLRSALDPAAPSTWTLAGRLLRFALPSTLIMLLSGLSLLVDTYFVTGLGSAALAGVSLVFPVYLLLVMAFGGGIGVGLSVVLSVRLGRGDRAGAQRAIGSAFALALGLAGALMAGFELGGRDLFAHITSTAPVLDAAVQFARPLFLGGPVIAVCLTLSNILRSEQRVAEAAVMLLVSSGVNAALNPILIHGYLGAPAMGVAGAGMATVLGFAVSAALGAFYLRAGRGHRLALGRAALQLDRSDVLAIARIALPTLGTYIATKGVLMALSILWARFGTDALAGFGLATRLEYLLAVVIYGIGSAILTLGGGAWGAGKARELVRICWIGAGCVVLATSLVSLVLVVSPAAWFGLFGASPAVVDSGVRYLRITALAYPFYGLALTLNYGYQTVGRAHLPLVWSLVRGFTIAVPITAVVAAPGGSIATAAAGVAASMVLLGLVTAGWMRRSLAKTLAPMSADVG